MLFKEIKIRFDLCSYQIQHQVLMSLVKKLRRQRNKYICKHKVYLNR